MGKPAGWGADSGYLRKPFSEGEGFFDCPDFIRPFSTTAHPALWVVGEAARSTQKPHRPFQVVTRKHCDTVRTCNLKLKG